MAGLAQVQQIIARGHTLPNFLSCLSQHKQMFGAQVGSHSAAAAGVEHMPPPQLSDTRTVIVKEVAATIGLLVKARCRPGTARWICALQAMRNVPTMPDAHASFVAFCRCACVRWRLQVHAFLARYLVGETYAVIVAVKALSHSASGCSLARLCDAEPRAA